MRKISVMLVAVMLLIGGNAFANNPENGGVDPAKKLREQVKQILAGYTLKPTEKNLIAEVVFTVNKKKEIVVLTVKTDNETFERYIKGRLNYREAKSNGVVEGRRYTIPVRIMG